MASNVKPKNKLLLINKFSCHRCATVTFFLTIILWIYRLLKKLSMLEQRQQLLWRHRSVIMSSESSFFYHIRTSFGVHLKAHCFWCYNISQTWQTEQMSRIVNELDSIHFSIKKASQLVKEIGRQVIFSRSYCMVL